MWWGHYGPGPGPGFDGFGWIFPVVFLVFWALVITGIVLLVRYLVRHLGPSAAGAGGGGWYSTRQAEATLADRFARGEIDEEQYRQRMDVLRQHR